MRLNKNFAVREECYIVSIIVMIHYNLLTTGHMMQVFVDVGAPSTLEDRKAHLQWRLEEQRVIRAGTLSRLVAAMTADRSGELDSNHVNILLATYRNFTTANNLLSEIINRCGRAVIVDTLP